MWKMLATDRVHIVKPVGPARSAHLSAAWRCE
jgi:hypothetical protein